MWVLYDWELAEREISERDVWGVWEREQIMQSKRVCDGIGPILDFEWRRVGLSF